jgi:hypothetical protein
MNNNFENIKIILKREFQDFTKKFKKKDYFNIQFENLLSELLNKSIEKMK